MADFGKTHDGSSIQVFTLANGNGMEVRVCTYGGTVISLRVPRPDGVLDDVVLGFESLEGYLNPKQPYFGALIGRYCNRIGGARFSLNGKRYLLPANDNRNTLHGGKKGFDKVVWMVRESAANRIELTYDSKDGEEGFPGNLNAGAVYHLTESNEFRIDYTATTDKDTIVSLTNHSYFNLKGAGNGDIRDHIVAINAARYTPVDSNLIPTGELAPVAGTPFDFTKPTAIGSRIGADNAQLKLAGGYDHNYVINRTGSGLELAAHVEEPASGRVLEVLTTEPGIQLYTGNFLDGTLTGKSGKKYGRRAGFCLETQHFPDSPNQPRFPSATLRRGETYRSATVYRFSVARHG